VCDSKAWKHIDSTWLDFVMDLCNIILGLSLDEVNPYANLSTNHFIWSILFFNYNLPPWLMTKQLFVMLSLLIQRKKSMKNDNIDVYLEPLVEEFKTLWKGVWTIDVTRVDGFQTFLLKAICIWNIHDYPTYGLFMNAK
jgi:hypothetical protein